MKASRFMSTMLLTTFVCGAAGASKTLEDIEGRIWWIDGYIPIDGS